MDVLKSTVATMRYAKEICDAIMAKCLTGQTKTVEKAQLAFLLWVELEAVEVFLVCAYTRCMLYLTTQSGISRNFRTSRQEDAHEYMVHLLESMHKRCLPSGVPYESPNAYEKSLVHKIFGGSLRSQVKCMQCSYCSNKFDPFLDLSLEIVKADSLHKALGHFTAAEQLDGGEKQYMCQQCKQKVRAVKQLTIDKAPYVLTIHLKRFGSHISGQKIDKKDHFGPILDLKSYMSGSSVDRYIPNRSAMDFDYVHHILTDGCKKKNPISCSPSKEAYKQQLKEVFGMNRTRILAFKNCKVHKGMSGPSKHVNWSVSWQKCLFCLKNCKVHKGMSG